MRKGITGIITGAGSGIGQGAAIEFGRTGCNVVLVGRRAEACDRVAELVEDVGGKALVQAGDIRDGKRLQEMAKATQERFGRIDFLVANAGITYQSSIVDGDPEKWRAVIETNVLGTMLSVQAVVPYMLDQGGGHLFIVSSISGRVAHVGEPAYVASKFAGVGLGHALRMELESENIRVTIVEPGLVETPILQGNPRVPEILERVTPLTPTDIARSMVFAFQQPPHVAVNEIAIRPMGQ